MNYRRAYIGNSKIFITMVTSKRRHILIKNIDLIRESFKQIKEKISFKIDAIVILPDHIHMIIQPKVSRLGFNPTTKGRKSKINLKQAA